MGNAPLSRVELDKRIWVGDMSGFFDCKSFFDLLIDSSDDTTFAPHNMIWKIGIPLKVRIFSWLAAWSKVNTCDLLQSKRPNLAISPSWCILCRSDNESVNHILLHCNFTHYTLSKARSEFGIIGALSRFWYEFLSIEWGVG